MVNLGRDIAEYLWENHVVLILYKDFSLSSGDVFFWKHLNSYKIETFWRDIEKIKLEH